jgi:dTDP-4-dehydrorhamnose 3,5-epimerase
MKFKSIELKDSFIIESKKLNDNRGFFSRILCSKKFKKKKLTSRFVQINNSFSKKKNTLRGMHYQLYPFAESKVIRCIKGSIFDVILDLRKNSKTFGKWFGMILSEDNRKMIYVPKGFAHGFLTLEDNTEVLYFSSSFYNKKYEKGIMYDDPKFSIKWPTNPKIISKKDSSWPYFIKTQFKK